MKNYIRIFVRKNDNITVLEEGFMDNRELKERLESWTYKLGPQVDFEILN